MAGVRQAYPEGYGTEQHHEDHFSFATIPREEALFEHSRVPHAKTQRQTWRCTSGDAK